MRLSVVDTGDIASIGAYVQFFQDCRLEAESVPEREIDISVACRDNEL